ncbi:putative root meristem growth factor 8 [Cucumis melo var. makuwa]|uniref:Root meristem growth factor 8 n=2 Tax=Cucumis melo TaxID=3656 RepID=A0A5D3CCI7_CUCMM|nr:putative root meristem growth factor 8 [Cucumis melo var. makuwa]TYK09040.1 putative root meristem growth factor 8 [Cucumis melo var. makuwa]
MGLIVMAILCCVSILILLIPSASSHALDQSSPLQATEAVHSPRLVLGRKFKMLKEAARLDKRVETQGFQVAKQNDNHKENVSGEEEKGMKLNKRKGRKGVNVADMSSQIFTMDYAHLKRRRPVHNMSLNRP